MCFGHSGFAYCGSFVYIPYLYIILYNTNVYTLTTTKTLEGDSTIDGESQVGRNLA